VMLLGSESGHRGTQTGRHTATPRLARHPSMTIMIPGNTQEESNLHPRTQLPAVLIHPNME
jgi:hypothetical protein